MHKLYSVDNKLETTLGSKHGRELQTSGVNLTQQDPTDWLITSPKLILRCGGDSKSEFKTNSASITTRLYRSHNLMINVT